MQCCRGDHVVKFFLKAFIREKDALKYKLTNAKLMRITEEEKYLHQLPCVICVINGLHLKRKEGITAIFVENSEKQDTILII